MATIEIVTSITGGKNKLRNGQAWGHAKWTAFMDAESKSESGKSHWDIKPAYDRFKDPRRNSRIHKLLIHRYSEADVTIWIDGRLRLLKTPEEIVKEYLPEGYDMAIYNHIKRDCIYDEAMTCAKLGLDDAEVIIEQAKYYEDHEYGKHKGLCEGGFIIRRNSERTQAFNEAWWSDYCRFSRRDQISLMPAIEKSGIVVNVLPVGYALYPDGSARRQDDVVEIIAHQHLEGNWNPNLEK